MPASGRTQGDAHTPFPCMDGGPISFHLLYSTVTSPHAEKAGASHPHERAFLFRGKMPKRFEASCGLTLPPQAFAFPEPQGSFSVRSSSLAWFLRGANERERDKGSRRSCFSARKRSPLQPVSTLPFSMDDRDSIPEKREDTKEMGRLFSRTHPNPSRHHKERPSLPMRRSAGVLRAD